MKENARERITSSFQKHAYWTPSPYNMENATSCLLPSFSPYQYRSFRFQRSRRRCLSKDRPHIGKNDYRGVYTIKVQDSWRLLIHAHNLVTAHFLGDTASSAASPAACITGSTVIAAWSARPPVIAALWAIANRLPRSTFPIIPWVIAAMLPYVNGTH